MQHWVPAFAGTSGVCIRLNDKSLSSRYLNFFASAAEPLAKTPMSEPTATNR
jgi:hypothetical protein